MIQNQITNNDNYFNEIVQMIALSKDRAYQAVNVLLIDLY